MTGRFSLFLYLVWSLTGEASGGKPPPCSDPIAFASLRSLHFIDRNGVTIGGELKYDGDYVYLAFNQEEPLAVGTLNPLVFAEGIVREGSVLRFTHVTVYRRPSPYFY